MKVEGPSFQTNMPCIFSNFDLTLKFKVEGLTNENGKNNPIYLYFMSNSSHGCKEQKSQLHKLCMMFCFRDRGQNSKKVH